MKGTSVIQRVSAFWGLAALTPIGVLLFQDELSLLQAGVRGLAILAGVIAIRWLADRVVRTVASTLDRASDSESTPRRRAEDGEVGTNGTSPGARRSVDPQLEEAETPARG